MGIRRDRKVWCGDWVVGECRSDVLVEGVNVHDCGTAEGWAYECRSADGGIELFGSEEWVKVLQVDCGIVAIPLF